MMVMKSRFAAIIIAAIVGGSLIAGCMVGAQREDRAEPVDLIIHNGRVFTGAGRPRAEAIAVRGGAILQVGSNAAIRRLQSRATRLLDARGGAVLPGFNDSHVHFVGGGLGLEQINLLDAETPDAISGKIRAFAVANPDRPWVLGRGWYYSPFPGGLPTRQLLDELVPDRPAYLTCYDGHTAWANTRALALAHFEEHRKGRLAPGQLADLVILSADILSLSPARLLDGIVDVTVFDGKVVYERGRN